MIVTIRRVDPATGRDTVSAAVLIGNCLRDESAPRPDPADEALMARVDARYAEDVPPRKCRQSYVMKYRARR